VNGQRAGFYVARYVTELQLCYIRPELSGVERALLHEAAVCTGTVRLKVWLLLDGAFLGSVFGCNVCEKLPGTAARQNRARKPGSFIA
jgi:hypothetical protein